jgi:hypothetical protein
MRVAVFNRKRNADFRSGDDIDGDFVESKISKANAETMSAEPARGRDMNEHDAGFVRDGFDGARRCFGCGADNRAAFSGSRELQMRTGIEESTAG